MAEIRVSRQGVQALVKVEGDPEFRVSRQGIQALVKSSTLHISRQGIQALVNLSNPELRISKQGVQALVRILPKLRVSRQVLQALVQVQPGEGALRVSRQGIQALVKLDEEHPIIAAVSEDDLFTFYLANWAAEVEVETRYLTDVRKSPETQVEERRLLRDRPYRLVTFLMTGMTQEESVDMLMNLMRMSVDHLALYLISDQLVTYQAGSGSATWPKSVFVDWRNHRFFVGQRVRIFDSFSDNNEYATIQTRIGTTQPRLDMVDNLQYEYEQANIYPVLECEPRLRGTLEAITDHHNEIPIKFSEASAATALPPTANASSNQFIKTNQGGSESIVFHFPPNWKEDIDVGVFEPGSEAALGRGRYVETRSDRPPLQFSIPLLFDSRQLFFEALQFFDSRRGRVGTFWLPNPETCFELFALPNLFAFTVKPFGNLQNAQDFVKHIAIVQKEIRTSPGSLQLKPDGIVIRGVTSIVEDITFPGYWRINLDAQIPLTIPLANLERVTTAHFVRFAEDAFAEKWVRKGVCQVRLNMVELLNEQDVEIPIYEPPDYRDDGIYDNLVYIFEANALFLMWEDTSENDPVERDDNGLPSYVDHWYPYPNNFAGTEGVAKSSVNDPGLLYFSSATFNGGNNVVAAYGDAFERGGLNLQRSQAETEVPQFWAGQTGFCLTYVAMFIEEDPIDAPYGNEKLFYTTQAIIRLTDTTLELFGDATVSLDWESSWGAYVRNGSPHIIMANFTPGGDVQVFVDGHLVAEYVAGLLNTLSVAQGTAKLFEGTSTYLNATGGNNANPADSGQGEFTGIMEVWIHDMPLSVSSLNALGSLLSAKFNTSWNSIS